MSDVIRRVRRADPAPETSRLFLSHEELTELFEERRDGEGTQVIDLSSPLAATRRPRWIAAVATFVAVLALGAMGILVGQLTQSQPAMTAEEHLALSTARDFFQALTDGDAAAAADLMRPELLQEEPWIRPGLEFLAALSGAKTVDDCTTERRDNWTQVSCVIIFDEPLFVATGQDSKTGIMTVDEAGLLTSRPALGFRTPVDRAFLEYASAVEPEAFADVCSVGAYEAGTVQTRTGYSWTGPCGELWASLTDEAAAWVDAGKPPLSEAQATALQAAEDFMAALTRGDAGAALELMQPETRETPTVAPLLEFVAALPGSKTLNACTTSDDPRGITVTCQIDFNGPLFHAIGQTTATGSLLMRGGLVGEAPNLGRRSDVDNVFVEYASQVEPDVFAEACSSGSYEPGSVRVDTDGYVFAGPCGQLWARLADDMASWVNEGKPLLDDALADR